ncbi:hypothetical protein GCM10011331_20540 [Flavimobilis marinus]|uniref:ABC-2 type transport system permease protein n=1 Tax=Flavimobilis marinus TaxID=285351 RepID=A0A1I2H1H6_9MICO|nr:ABC transporter permease [Flavimobilis marinus]GHG54614.1 hypothetical protein GCM10011331_20540 [Flavimobilis marinus]SFF23243.1 ABC-2 type transport system permease protein [Flavimobilis marinus]
MTGLQTSVHVELTKAWRSRVLRTTTLLVVVGIAAIGGAMVAAADGGNAQIVAKLGPLADRTGWALLTGVTAQITAAGALLAFGVGLSWTYGREFADHTVTGLFALPVPRSTIAVAKLVVHLVWVLVVALALTALVLVAGLALRLGPLDADVVAQLARQLALGTLTGLVAVPAAWAATLGRGLLAGIGATLAILVVAQVTAIASLEVAAWLPVAAPALWALDPGAVHAGQLATVLVVPLGFGALTVLAWRRLQLDR